ncbi:hypothetical protein F5Y16DRAFT_367268 [Xylariaceae sp. FL0255]|nr:hypothetical protein F5Y16DRAFT_367268 [Xylariaceae sp. FL0255]
MDSMPTTSASFAPPPDSPSSSSRISAPYGQACVSCVKAKCKCIITNTSQSSPGRDAACERCTRLKRECVPSVGARKQRGRHANARVGSVSGSTPRSSTASAVSRAATLEQKLEDLVAILKAQASSGTSATSPSTAESAASRIQLALQQEKNGEHGPNNPIHPAIRGASMATPAPSQNSSTSPGSASTPYTAAAVNVDVNSPISVAEAEEVLNTFRTKFIPFFPLAYLPPAMSAAQLANERPTFWRNIRTLCCKSPIKQLAMTQQFREELGYKLLGTGERTIDMLLSVLVCLGWMMHFFSGKPTLTVFMNMCMAIVADLRLDRPVTEANLKDVNCFKAPPEYNPPLRPMVRTNEERRATLAAYIFCSCGASLTKSQSMHWTPHMEESFRLLKENPDCENDKVLVVMVQTRRLMESVSQITRTVVPECESLTSLKPPAVFYVNALRQNIQTLKDQIPESIRGNRVVISCILSADMIITDMPFLHAVTNSNCVTLPDPNPTPPLATHHTSRSVDINRLEAYYATLQTSKAFMENFLNFPLSDHLGFSFPVFLYFFRASQILYRLILTEEPGWDRNAVLESVDLVGAIEKLASRFAHVSDFYGYKMEVDVDGKEKPDFYMKCAKTMRATAPMWRTGFVQAGLRVAGETGSIGGGGGAGAGGAGGLGAGGMHMQTGASMMGASQASGYSNGVGGGGGSVGGGGTGTGAGNPAHMMGALTFPDIFPIDFSFDETWTGDVLSAWDIPTMQV